MCNFVRAFVRWVTDYISRAAALATSCKAEIKVGRPHYELKQNPALGKMTIHGIELSVIHHLTVQDFSNALTHVGLDWADAEAKASTDFVSF